MTGKPLVTTEAPKTDPTEIDVSGISVQSRPPIRQAERCLLATSILLWTALVTGCGPRPEPVGTATGRVTLGGKAVTGCSVMFEPEQGGATVFAPLDGDGRYAVRTYREEGVRPGRYRLAIVPGTGAVDDLLVSDDTRSSPRTAVPERFLNTKTSGITLLVNEGVNPDFDIDVSQ